MTSRLLRLLLALACLCWAAVATAQEDPWFALDEINAGMPAVPDTVDRRTPRTALKSFIVAARDRDWATAAHLLDLSDLPAERQPVDGPRLAEQLYELLERKAVIDWQTFLQRPDGLQVRGGQNDSQAGEPRRSLLLRDIDLDPVPAAIRLDRVKVGEDGDPFWIFPRETVDDIDAMHAVYGPKAFERALPEALRQKGPLGLYWWEVLGLPILLAMAIGLGRFVHLTMSWLWRRVGRRRLPSRVLRAVSGPLIVASITTLVSVVTRNIFVFSGQIDLFIGPIVAIGFVAAVLMFIVNVAEAVMDTLMAPGDDVDLTAPDHAESRAIATRLNAAKRILVVIVVIVGAGIVLSTADIFRSIGLSLLASAGAFTLVLGFAARDVLGNIMSSLQIALNQSARVGDRIVYDGELCHVERIHMTYVQLRHWEGTRLIVPVKEFVSKDFMNWSMVEPEMLRIIKFKFDPRVDVQHLREVFDRVVEEVAATDVEKRMGDLTQTAVNVAGQDALGLDVWFNVPCNDANTSWEVACDVRERMIMGFAAAFAPDAPLFPRGAVAETG